MHQKSTFTKTKKKSIMINIGIVGGTGFTAGELLRILDQHNETNVSWVYSRSSKGQPLSSVHTDLEGIYDLNFTDSLDWNIDAIFLCLPHGATTGFLKENPCPSGIKIIDLSNDFRLGTEHGYVYGLPELNRSEIKKTNLLANPGCFATSIQLALLPLASLGVLDFEIHVTAVTGSTGAGKGLSATTHFTWRTGNMSVYKALRHQHLGEIHQSLNQLQAGFDQKIVFVPMRGNFTRGILASIYTKCSLSPSDALIAYQNFYEDHPFVTVTDQPIDMKQIVNTNRAKISVNVIDDYIHLVSTIDNLVKGASGQAIQNMNLMFGLDENKGLNMKSIAY